MSSATNTRTILILLGLMALAGALSLMYFSQQSLRLDEAQSLWQTGRSPTQILTIIAQDVHVPLYHELLHLWRLYAGDSVAWARAFSLLFYILSIPALYILGKRAYSANAGLFAAALFTISPFMNWYGGEIRMYTMFVFLVIVNQICFLMLWRQSTNTEKREHAWAWYAITAVLGIYTHYFFFLLLGTQALFYFLHRELFEPRALRRFIFAAALVLACFAPWAISVFLQGQAGNQSPFLPTPNTVDLFSTFSQFFFGFVDDHLNTFMLSLWPIGLIIGFGALRSGNRFLPQTEYFLLSVIVPISVVFALSFVIPLFVSRYLIFTVPSLYLVITSLISTYPERVAVFARRGLVVAMAGMLVVEMINPSTPVKENYRGAALYLSQKAQAQDIIALSAPFTVYPIEYYYRGNASISTLPTWDRYAYGAIPPFVEAKLPDEVTATTGGHQNVWLLLSYDQGYQAQIKEYFDTHFKKIDQENFSPGLNLYEYKVRYDTPLSRLTGSSTALLFNTLSH